MENLVAMLGRQGDPLDVVLEGAHSYSRAALLDEVGKLAALLQAQGIRRLALHADNGSAWIIADLACQQAGILCVPVPLFFSRTQLQHVLQACGIDAVLTAAPEEFQEVGYRRSPLVPLPGLNLLLQPEATAPLLPEGCSKITFTSGSTGTPKGVCLGTAQQLLQAQALASAVGLHAPRHLCVLPLGTLLENIAGVYAPLLAGGTVVVSALAELGYSGSRLQDPQRMLQMIARVRPDSLILIPQLLQLLVQAVKAGWQAPAFRFIAVGGSKVSAELLLQARALGLPVYEGYGLSECASVVSLNTPDADQPGTCGKVLPHLQVSLAGREIVVSGNAMLGYVDEPASWYRTSFATGDLGHVDSEGFLHVDGRSKNLLISSYGRNISPEWVESELLTETVLAEAVVLGDARPFCVALLGARHDRINDAQIAAAVAAANARLPDYARVRQWLRLKEPLANGNGLLTANGRPRRERIAQVYGAGIEQLYAQAWPHTASAARMSIQEVS